MEEKNDRSVTLKNHLFTGNIFIFHAFDIGDDINLEKVESLRAITEIPIQTPKYFKNYHAPLSIELPHPHESAQCSNVKLHNFGALSLTYAIPFEQTLVNLRKDFNELYNEYLEQSIQDAKSVYKKIEKCIAQPKFFLTQSSYIVIQINPEPHVFNIDQLKQEFGGIITSTLRFETQVLSEAQKNEMLDSALGYFRGDMIIIDTDAAFIYDAEYEDVLDLFEFANVQQLEFRYFDRLLDTKLQKIYEAEGKRMGIRTYLPFVGMPEKDPVTGLGKLRVDISVITERLESSIKLAEEPYISELYELLSKKLDLKSWQAGIDRKLDIVQDVQTIYQNKIDAIREDLLTTLIIVLIFIELVIGILSYLK